MFVTIICKDDTTRLISVYIILFMDVMQKIVIGMNASTWHKVFIYILVCSTGQSFAVSLNLGYSISWCKFYSLGLNPKIIGTVIELSGKALMQSLVN